MAPFDLTAGTLGYALVFGAIGFGFGAVLEMGGFGDTRKLAAQFYLRDMTVLKVMFTGDRRRRRARRRRLGLRPARHEPRLREPDLPLARDRRRPRHGRGLRRRRLLPRHLDRGGLDAQDRRRCSSSSARSSACTSSARRSRASRPSGSPRTWGASRSPSGSACRWASRCSSSSRWRSSCSGWASSWSAASGRARPGRPSRSRPAAPRSSAAPARSSRRASCSSCAASPRPTQRWAWMPAEVQRAVEERAIFVDPAEVVALRKDLTVQAAILDLRDEHDFNLFHVGGARRVDPEALLRSEEVDRLLEQPAEHRHLPRRATARRRRSPPGRASRRSACRTSTSSRAA